MIKAAGFTLDDECLTTASGKGRSNQRGKNIHPHQAIAAGAREQLDLVE
jgi:hypothetical protein